MANAVSAFLDDTIGGGAGDRPALVTPTETVTYRELLPPAEWAAMLRDSRARVLVAEAALLAELRPALVNVPHLRAVVATGGGATSLQALLAAAAPDCGPEPVSGDDMAFWLYTSGTTGGPKAAIHLHRDLLACRHYGIDVLQAVGQ